jgi:hypothetical protein
VADIEETETGPLVTIRHSKTDQEGAGDIIAISRGDVACPVKGPTGMAAGRRYRGWRYLSADRQGQQVALRAAYGSVGCQYRQGLCVARRFGRNRVFRSFAPMGFLTSVAANVDFQDDGRITAQVRRHAPRLCPCRSCRDRFALGDFPPMPRGLGKAQRHLSFKPRLCRSPGG